MLSFRYGFIASVKGPDEVLRRSDDSDYFLRRRGSLADDECQIGSTKGPLGDYKILLIPEAVFESYNEWMQ